MGSFADAGQILSELARHPTSREQSQARQAGLQPVLEAAQARLAANGSNKTGQLSAALGIADKTRDTSAMGPIKGRRHASVGHLVELGTAPHYQPQRHRMHPGARPYPFMRPAFEETQTQMVGATAARLTPFLTGRV